MTDDPLYVVKLASPRSTDPEPGASLSGLLASVGLLVFVFIWHRVTEHTDAVLSLHDRLTQLEARDAS